MPDDDNDDDDDDDSDDVGVTRLIRSTSGSRR